MSDQEYEAGRAEIVVPVPYSLRVAGCPGSSEKKGCDGASDVFEVEHRIHQPVDLTTGQATGARVCSRLRVVKLIDKATVGLHKAMCGRQTLREVVLDFHHISPSGTRDAAYYRITLLTARVLGIRLLMRLSSGEAEKCYPPMEQISFGYMWIERRWIPDAVIEIDRAPHVPGLASWLA